MNGDRKSAQATLAQFKHRLVYCVSILTFSASLMSSTTEILSYVKLFSMLLTTLRANLKHILQPQTQCLLDLNI